jgi:hypothetical protein
MKIISQDEWAYLWRSSLVLLVLFVGLFFWSGCRKCVRGHNETQFVPGHYETVLITFIYSGDAMIPIYGNEWVADHYVNVFICDEYEGDNERRPVHP